ncbi:MAG TPA: transposase [Acidobacteriaceae bacterium]|jgi:putative transposase
MLRSFATKALRVKLFVKSKVSRAGTYFITAVANGRRRTFHTEQDALLLIETLQLYRREGKYLLHAFVVMPDHLHILITPKSATMERSVGLIKGGFSYRLQSKMPVWQDGYDDHRCRDVDEFISRREYIHMNPVRAGIVAEPHLFRFSSAYRQEQAPGG